MQLDSERQPCCLHGRGGCIHGCTGWDVQRGPFPLEDQEREHDEHVLVALLLPGYIQVGSHVIGIKSRLILSVEKHQMAVLLFWPFPVCFCSRNGALLGCRQACPAIKRRLCRRTRTPVSLLEQNTQALSGRTLSD